MLATIRDDIWNLLNMQHITQNSKRWDNSDIHGGGHKRLKDPPTWLKVATTLKKPQPPPAFNSGVANKIWWLYKSTLVE